MADEKKTFTEMMLPKIGASVLFTALVFIIAPVNVAMGWLAGWTVGFVFGDTILHALTSLGVHGVTLPQLGMTLGFVSAFLRTKITVTK